MLEAQRPSFDPEAPASNGRRPWRDEALEAMLRVAAVGVPVIAAVSLALRTPFELDVSAALLVLTSAAMVALRLLRGLGFRTRAGLAVATLHVGALGLVLRLGFSLALGAALVVAVVVALILLGRTAALLLAASTALGIVASGALVSSGLVSLELDMMDPRDLRNWARTAVAVTLLSAALAALIDYVVRHLEAKYAEVQSALGRLTEEQERRENLERERSRADAAWRRSAAELIGLGKLATLENGDLDAAFRAICEAGARGLEVERCSVWLLDEPLTRLRCENLFEQTRARHSSGLELTPAFAPSYFSAILDERVVAVRDIARDPRTLELDASYAKPLGIAALLDAPIRFQDKLAGVVCHEHVGSPRTWTAAEQSFAASLADFAARALSGSDRLGRERALRTAYDELGSLHLRLETIKEDERLSIARELHDQFGQSLTALKLRLAMLQAPGGSEASSLVDALIARVRKLSLDLRPPLLDELGLAAALRAYLDEQSLHSKVELTLAGAELPEPLSRELQVAAFRIVQEAVTNALRHARARRITVGLERQDRSLEITIRDDGQGFAAEQVLPRAAAQGHLGVVGMRERVRLLGGRFQLHSSPGRGATVHVSLPAGSPQSVRAAPPPS